MASKSLSFRRSRKTTEAIS